MRNHQRWLTYKSGVLASYIICEWRKKKWERRDYLKISKNALKTTLEVRSLTWRRAGFKAMKILLLVQELFLLFAEVGVGKAKC